jgi:hypothetical protein
MQTLFAGLPGLLNTFLPHPLAANPGIYSEENLGTL